MFEPNEYLAELGVILPPDMVDLAIETVRAEVFRRLPVDVQVHLLNGLPESSYTLSICLGLHKVHAETHSPYILAVGERVFRASWDVSELCVDEMFEVVVLGMFFIYPPGNPSADPSGDWHPFGWFKLPERSDTT